MAKKDTHNAQDIARGADKRLQPEAQELIEQAFFLRDRLEGLREELKTAPIITTYTNGETQSGTQINPAYKAYSELLKLYIRTLTALQKLLGKDPGEVKNTLAEIRSQFKAV